MSRARKLLCVASLAGVSACGEEGGIEPLTGPPSIRSAVVVDVGDPLLRAMTLDLDGPGGIVVDYWAAQEPPLRFRVDAPQGHHELLLSRLRADRAYQFAARAFGADGVMSDPETGTFTTGPLPDALRAVRFSAVGVPTFPLTMVEALSDELPYLPFVVDEGGNIVWYRRSDRGSMGFTRLEDGDFVFNSAGGLWVLGLRGETVARLDKARAAAETGIDPFTIHHDVIVTPANTLLMLVQDTTFVADTVWTGEAIWEWDPATDRLEKRWASKDFLDPRTDRGARTVPGDWHANSLSLGPRGNIVVSLFWLHEVLSISPDYASIEWRLGGPASDFRVEDRAMEAGQHTAAEVAPDRVLMFDNGRDREGGLYSRALEVELDHDAGVASVVWDFRPEPDIYAPILSSARRLGNGNTVVGFGTLAGFEGSTGPVAIFEVTPAGRTIWKLEVLAGFPFAYRATPLYSLGGETEVR